MLLLLIVVNLALRTVTRLVLLVFLATAVEDGLRLNEVVVKFGVLAVGLFGPVLL